MQRISHLVVNFFTMCFPFSPHVCFGVVSGPITSGESSLSIASVCEGWTFEGLVEPGGLKLYLMYMQVKREDRSYDIGGGEPVQKEVL